MKKIKTILLTMLLASTTVKAELATHAYEATIVSVYDGDTVRADIDLGFNVWVKDVKLRLGRINAPEMRGNDRPQGLISRDWLRATILNERVIIKTNKDKRGKYGRYIVEIYLNGENINDWLVKAGLAVHKQY